MKLLITLATLISAALFALFTPAARAGADAPCHFHGNKPAAASTVADCAQQRKAALIKAGKLDASWQVFNQLKAEVVDGKKGKEWELVFNNPAAADKDKQTLYMFFTEPGNFIAANFTGQ